MAFEVCVSGTRGVFGLDSAAKTWCSIHSLGFLAKNIFFIWSEPGAFAMRSGGYNTKELIASQYLMNEFPHFFFREFGLIISFLLIIESDCGQYVIKFNYFMLMCEFGFAPLNWDRRYIEAAREKKL